jgi:hypothetical protein
MNAPDIADLPEEYSPKRPMTEAEPAMTEEEQEQGNALIAFIYANSDRLDAYETAARRALFIDSPVSASIAFASKWVAERRITESHTLTVRAPYFQEQLEAVKADSSSHSDQPLPVAAPKQVKPHWTQAVATPVAAPVSLSLPRAWELRK